MYTCTCICLQVSHFRSKKQRSSPEAAPSSSSGTAPNQSLGLIADYSSSSSTNSEEEEQSQLHIMGTCIWRSSDPTVHVLLQVLSL